MFFKIGVLKIFTNCIGKHLCWGLQRRCFPVKFAKFLRTPVFTEAIRWLFLDKFLNFSDQLWRIQMWRTEPWRIQSPFNYLRWSILGK